MCNWILRRRRQGEDGAEAIFEAKMAKNFPQMYDRYPSTDSRCENTMKRPHAEWIRMSFKNERLLTFSITIMMDKSHLQGGPPASGLMHLLPEPCLPAKSVYPLSPAFSCFSTSVKLNR